MINFKWTISALDCEVSKNGLNNVVQRIHWNLSGINEKSISAEVYGVQILGDPNIENFKDFDSLEKQDVINWLNATMDVAVLEENIAQQIILIENPTMVTLQLKNENIS